MSDTLILLSFLAAIWVILFFIAPTITDEDLAEGKRKARRRYEDEPGFPDELRFASGAEVALVEGMPLEEFAIPFGREHFHCDHPVALSGIPDEVYRKADGDLVAVDTKPIKSLMNYAYLSEQIQLSVYRYIIAHGLDQPAANYGYIRRVDDAGNCIEYVRVPLLSDAEVEDLVHRRKAIARKEVSDLAPAVDSAFCKGCPQAGICPHLKQ